MPELPVDLPDDIDQRLWICTNGCHGRDYLWGNAHTFPGRIEAYCPHQARDFAVSKYEVIESSPEAKLWLDGFLRGNEPPPPDDEDLLPIWANSIKLFHHGGRWDQPE